MVADEGDDDGYAPIDWLADSHNEPTAAIARAATDRLQSTGILDALDGLDERSRRIEARWLSDGVNHLLCMIWLPSSGFG